MKLFVVLSAVFACTMAQVFYSGYPGYGYSPFVNNYAYSPYVRSIAAPVHAPVVHLPTSSQYHAQDELGQFTFGHSGDNQARVESKSFDGTVNGAYSYVDPTGKVVHVNYLADHNGFRVLGANNLPVAPVAPAVPELKGPEPVQDTPEVVAARADFQKAFDEAKKASEAAPAEVVVARRRRAAPVFYSAFVTPTLAKTTLKYKSFEPVDAATPADTKKVDLVDKETEVLTPSYSHVQVPVAAPVAYHAVNYNYHAVPYVGNHFYYHV